MQSQVSLLNPFNDSTLTALLSLLIQYTLYTHILTSKLSPFLHLMNSAIDP